ncbi:MULTISPECIES: hypothetical protein [Chromobacterium]|uniref:hypothetical protein n=1 Tax=Chromobacterium TaxID=535 RepID=UPI0018893A9D|nr:MULTISPECIES: hypothetical protein [Chromobacterium]WON84672.1 hypothetical protein OK026_03930 [Chromobacterium haemolyticum]
MYHADIPLTRTLRVADLQPQSFNARWKNLGRLGAYYSWGFTLKTGRQATMDKLLVLLESAAHSTTPAPATTSTAKAWPWMSKGGRMRRCSEASSAPPAPCGNCKSNWTRN